MKYLNITVLLAMICFISCKKEVAQQEEGLESAMALTLKKSISSELYTLLDLKRAVEYRIDTMDKYYIRIPLKEATASTSFVMLQVVADGGIVKGRKVNLKRNKKIGREGEAFNGQIQVYSLTGHKVQEAIIENGYVKRHYAMTSIMSAELVQPDPYQTLPTVVVSATRNSDNTYTYRDWLSMQYIMGDGGSGNVNYYTSIESDVYGGGGSNSGGGSGTIGEGNLLMIDFETQGSLPPIDLEKYIHCFNKIPDAGASCTIEVFADIPVDGDPNKLFDLGTQSPGHTFIQIKKTNGSQSILQNIGFYPEKDWKSIVTTAPINGKFIDNEQHEFNASIKMDVSSENFKSILIEILYRARFIKYDIDEYNCTDFALDIFNKIRTNKLNIPLYAIPSSITAGGTRTPQGLYNLLKQMKLSGNQEAANITIGNYKNWVANSTGPCN